MHLPIKTLICSILVAATTSAAAKGPDIEKYHAEIMELSIDDNLLTPEIPKKQLEAAKETIKALATNLRNAGLTTDTSERDGLVLMVTVPVSDLFEANDTELSSKASQTLKQLQQHLRTPDKYKLLIAVHSDDTGSEEYLNELTELRAEAILQWLANKGIPTGGIVTYGLGYDEPLSTRPGRQQRARNRRVEFYFVPGPILIEQLKAKR